MRVGKGEPWGVRLEELLVILGWTALIDGIAEQCGARIISLAGVPALDDGVERNALYLTEPN